MESKNHQCSGCAGCGQVKPQNVNEFFDQLTTIAEELNLSAEEIDERMLDPDEDVFEGDYEKP